jgi:hypothetical protein
VKHEDYQDADEERAAAVVHSLRRDGETATWISNSEHDEPDPLDGVDLFTPVYSVEESRRRAHARTFADIAVDVKASKEDRENAIRHILVCDPARGIGALLDLHNEASSKATLYKMMIEEYDR